MIAAAYSNPNWDGKENAERRKDYLQDLNRHFNQAITRIYYPKGVTPEHDVDWSNPFYAAHKREIAKTRERFQEALDGKSATTVLKEHEEQDSSRNGREFDQE